MRIHVASDLHIEHTWKYFPGWRVIEPVGGTAPADLLVLAGDIANGIDAIEHFRDWPYPVILVPGNHEYYGGEVATVRAQMAAHAARRPNVTLLDRGVAVIGGVRFVGATLWTDYALYGEAERPRCMAAAEIAMHDHRAIEIDGRAFRATDALALHALDRAFLAEALATPFDGPTVVITHHVPHRCSIHPRYEGDPVNAAFASDLGELMGKAVLHVHGHTHYSFDYTVDGTRVVANPHGYCRGRREAATPADLVRENADFDPQRVVTI